MFKSVIFPAISLSWCVASGLTGPPGPGEHELEQGLSLSSPPILAHHLHPERFMERINEALDQRTDGTRREDRREFRRVPVSRDASRLDENSRALDTLRTVPPNWWRNTKRGDST